MNKQQKATESNNRIIAEFMKIDLTPEGKKFNSLIDHATVKEMKFHSDWNWLMDVVKMIENLGYNVIITSLYASVNKLHSAIYLVNIYSVDGPNKLDATYTAIVEFIKWYKMEKLSIEDIKSWLIRK